MSRTSLAANEDLHDLLELEPASPWRRWLPRLAILAVVVALVVLALLWRARSNAAEAPRYRTIPARAGDLVEKVTATGTVSALDTVDVGPEVSGRILEVHADFNDRVTRGQALVTLELEQASARFDQVSAQLMAARASVSRAEATADEAAKSFARARQLREAGVVSAQDFDSAEASARRATAEVESARAQATVAAASLAQARADLGKTVIRSPIDGIVLARAAEVGQNVAASFQPPVLFTLARDLAAMQLSVDVDEADVGKVREGQTATFSVDAHPGKTFASQVLSLHNVAKAEQNVVTYEAVLAVDNKGLLLRPGMTATAEIVVDEKRGVLLVPNAALRFTPPEVVAAERGGGGLYIPGLSRGAPPGMRQNRPPQSGQATGGAGAGGPRRAPAAGGVATREGGARAGEAVPSGVVWVLRDAKPVAVPVETGATDGSDTEVRSPELAVGDPLIVDVMVAAAARR